MPIIEEFLDELDGAGFFRFFLFFENRLAVWLLAGSDLKCGFGRDWEKSLKCGNRVPYRGENAVGQLQNLSNAAVSSRIGHILNHC